MRKVDGNTTGTIDANGQMSFFLNKIAIKVQKVAKRVLTKEK